MEKATKISIIIPTYQEAGNIPALAGRLYAAAAGQFDLEMIIVDVFTYDALGRRIEKIEYSPGGNTTTRYYYDGWKVLTETDASQSRQRDFIWGNYLDEALVMVVDAGESDTDYYYAHDHLFSPVALMEDDGDIVERYEYGVYGELTRLNPDFTEWTGTEAGNPLYFTGQRLDTIGSNGLELMYYKNRYYQPEFGRFITRDPLGVRDGIGNFEFASNGVLISPRKFNAKDQYMDGMGLYEYALSNPERYLDMLGTICSLSSAGWLGPTGWPHWYWWITDGPLSPAPGAPAVPISPMRRGGWMQWGYSRTVERECECEPDRPCKEGESDYRWICTNSNTFEYSWEESSGGQLWKYEQITISAMRRMAIFTCCRGGTWKEIFKPDPNKPIDPSDRVTIYIEKLTYVWYDPSNPPII